MFDPADLTGALIGRSLRSGRRRLRLRARARQDRRTCALGGSGETAYALSAAEAQLAEALARGVSPADHAEHRGVRISTVRSQIRSLLAKTGSSGQMDLVQRILRRPLA